MKSDRWIDTSGIKDRQNWLGHLERLARPVLTAQADGRLSRDIPREMGPGATENRIVYAPLEAVGRLLSGIAPWLEQQSGDDNERRLRKELLELTRRALKVGLDPSSGDHLNFVAGEQCIVDASYLALALLRAPKSLLGTLDSQSRTNLVSSLIKSRMHLPVPNNHLLFAGLIEALLTFIDEPADLLRVDHAVRTHERWYRGDGVYSDGEKVQMDYYQSYVIHPYLMMIGDVYAKHDPSYDATWTAIFSKVVSRAKRAAFQQMTMISPDGSHPAMGRSICYRGGAFHLLADMALREKLPTQTSPAQVRRALTAVINRTLNATTTYDADGWLRLGLAGHQPKLCEYYITTGSLYLCSNALLPLGLPPTAPFWASPVQKLPWELIWDGDNSVAGDKPMEWNPQPYGGNGWTVSEDV
jgi:hypothetical protein